MLRFQNENHPHGSESAVEVVDHLIGEGFLKLEPCSKVIQNPRHLGESQNFSVGDVPKVCHTPKREEVVGAR